MPFIDTTGLRGAGLRIDTNQRRSRAWLIASAGMSCCLATAGIGSPAAADLQDSKAASAASASDETGAPAEIVVEGRRGSAVTDVAPIAVVDAGTIAATGVTSIGDLLRTIRGVTQSADGVDPILLLNGQRVSSYQEIGTLPPEALDKVEVLPEPAALKFGYSPTRRVVNFITKRRFRQVSISGTTGSTTRSYSSTDKATAGLTRLHDDSRFTLSLEARHTDRLLQSDRHILPDPDVLFDAIGNVVSPGGGEIDAALSEAAGQPVTVSAVPQEPADRGTLAGFAAGANRSRAFDLGPYRTLVPRNDAAKAEAVIADRIGGTLAGSLTLSAEQSRDRMLGGPAAASLTVPGTNAFSPFAGTVLLDRYLTEVDPLRQRQTTTTLHAGGTLRGAVAGWSWDLTAGIDQQQVDGLSERGIDLSAANAAIAGGLDPFTPFDPDLLDDRLVDHARLRTRNANAKSVVTGTPVRLPAGKATVTATADLERASARSRTRGADPFDLALDRTRVEAGFAVDLPITSRRNDVLPFVGELSLNASATARRVGGFGALHDSTYGASWSLFTGLQLLATVKHSETAPPIAQQSSPTVSIPDVPVFDFTSGRTETVTLVQGGNPGLLAEHRAVRSLAVNVKPLAKSELRLSATYDVTTIRNQSGTVYALTPRTQAELPDLFVRDAAGRLVSVTLRPINFDRERQRTLNLTVNASGHLGKPLPAAAGGPAPEPPSYYGGIGPSIKFLDRLELRPGAGELDLLHGDTVTGGGTARAFGYAYGGISYLGNGLTFDFWCGGANRVRSANPAADLRFATIFKLNMGGYVGLHHLFKTEAWTQHLQLRIDVSNVTDAHQRVRDGAGRVPNRFQPDYLDPVGRTISLTLRKLF